MTETKRDIRHDIAEITHLNEFEGTGYDAPEGTDRRFNLRQLSVILRYLDRHPPKKRAATRGRKDGSTNDYAKTIADATEDIVGERVDAPRPGKSWSGFNKTDLQTIRDAVDTHDPIGLPAVDDLANYIQSKADVSEATAQGKARRYIRERKKGNEDVTVGFRVEDVTVKTHHSVGVLDDRGILR